MRLWLTQWALTSVLARSCNITQRGNRRTKFEQPVTYHLGQNKCGLMELTSSQPILFFPMCFDANFRNQLPDGKPHFKFMEVAV
ncbi:hypothetical protein Hanom_Chr16g01451121 [Helianthus anomalus]